MNRQPNPNTNPIKFPELVADEALPLKEWFYETCRIRGKKAGGSPVLDQSLIDAEDTEQLRQDLLAAIDETAKTAKVSHIVLPRIFGIQKKTGISRGESVGASRPKQPGFEPKPPQENPDEAHQRLAAELHREIQQIPRWDHKQAWDVTKAHPITWEEFVPLFRYLYNNTVYYDRTSEAKFKDRMRAHWEAAVDHKYRHREFAWAIREFLDRFEDDEKPWFPSTGALWRLIYDRRGEMGEELESRRLLREATEHEERRARMTPEEKAAEERDKRFFARICTEFVSSEEQANKEFGPVPPEEQAEWEKYRAAHYAYRDQENNKYTT